MSILRVVGAITVVAGSQLSLCWECLDADIGVS